MKVQDSVCLCIKLCDNNDGLEPMIIMYSHEQMQEKTDLLHLVSAQTGLNVNINKTKIMKANTKSKNVVTVEGKPLEETDCFT